MKGAWEEGKVYNKLWQVTDRGSTFQSKVDNNSTRPTTIGTDGKVTLIHKDLWLCIADATDAKNTAADIAVVKQQWAEEKADIDQRQKALEESVDENIKVNNQVTQSNINANNQATEDAVKKAEQAAEQANEAQTNADKAAAAATKSVEDINAAIAAGTGGAVGTATNVVFDNTDTELEGQNVQSALSETAKKLKVDESEEGGTNVNDVLKIISNSDYMFAVIDADKNVLGGFKWNGEVYVAEGMPEACKALFASLQKQITENKEFVDSAMRIVEDDNWLLAIIDEDNNVMLGLDRKGELYAPKGMPEDTKTALKELWAYVKAKDSSDDERMTKAETLAEERHKALEEKLRVVEGQSFLAALIDAANNRLITVNENGDYVIAKDFFSDNGFSLRAMDTGTKALFAFVDKVGNLLAQIGDDGKLYAATGVTIGDWQSGIKVVDTNSEWLFGILDAEGNVLAAIDEKGGLFCNSLRGALKAEVVDNDEWLVVLEDCNGNIACGIKRDMTFYAPKVEVPGMAKEGEDAEFLYVILDAERKVLGGIWWNGEWYMPKGIPEEQKAKNKDFESRLAKLENVIGSGELKTKMDWSDKSLIYIPTPRYAVMNITGISRMPWAKLIDLHAWVEFWDMNGNYFKKRAIMNAQGNSSMGFVKKNFAMDFCDDAWIGDETPTIKIGDWVGQDSFHCKAYYTDFFRGVGVVTYQLFEQIVKTRGNMKDKPWKKALIDMDAIGTTTKSFGNAITDDMELQTDTGALCHPDGFPVMVYFEGDFYGVFSFQIKKHRDNYHLKKKKVKHIHLDGDLYGANLWNGTVGWSGFEMRNPKALVYAERHSNATGGYKYDADVAQGEIAGTDKNYAGTYAEGTTYTEAQVVDMDFDGETEYFICTDPELANANAPTLKKNTYDDPDYKGKTKTGWLNCTGSVKVKAAIQKLAGYMTTLNNLAKITTTNGDITLGTYGGAYDASKNFGKGAWVLDSEKYYMSIHSSNTGNALTDTSYWVEVTETVSSLKSTFESMFDVENLIDYLICSDLTKNTDGFGKNWQWFTYDAKKWYVGIYDCDMSFGGHFQGNQITDVTTYHLGNSTWLPTGWIIRLYGEELKARYKELADAGIITADNIFGKLRDWQMRIGTDYMALEYEKWPDSPCNSESVVRTDYWELETDEDDNPKTATSETFDATKAYAVDEEASFGLNATMGYYMFKCIKATEALETNTAHTVSTYSPIRAFRHTDNLYRAEKWIDKQVQNMDTLYGYSRSA